MMAHNMRSVATFAVEEILPHVGEGNHFEHDGIVTRVGSLRMRTFKEKGVDCVVCGCKGAYFSLEQQAGFNKKKNIAYVGSYHLNLYGVTKAGTVRLMTHDHIIPKSNWGAPESIENSITMCEKCNCNKGNKIPSAEFVRAHGCAIVPYNHPIPESTNVQDSTVS